MKEITLDLFEICSHRMLINNVDEYYNRAVKKAIKETNDKRIFFPGTTDTLDECFVVWPNGKLAFSFNTIDDGTHTVVL